MLNSIPIMIALILGAAVLMVASLGAIVAVDRRRIVRRLEMQGMRVQHIQWFPFSRAEMGENMLRIYEVLCEDSAADVHHFQVKVAWLIASEIRIEKTGCQSGKGKAAENHHQS